MIAEEYLSKGEIPNVSISNKNVVSLINKLMKQTVPNFKSYLASGFHKKKQLNEEEFTQLFTKQAQILIRAENYPFNIEGEYKDVYNLSRGFSDFFFYPNEQNVSTASIFSVESKRLPSPEKYREKEYVIGDKNNGGIERYKKEKHGKGLNECGLLGFIEKEESKHWLKKINGWIEDLANSDTTWNKNEILTEHEARTDFSYLKSIAHRKTDDINLYHIWIKMS
jgi:hypothetical protein